MRLSSSLWLRRLKSLVGLLEAKALVLIPLNYYRRILRSGRQGTLSIEHWEFSIAGFEPHLPDRGSFTEQPLAEGLEALPGQVVKGLPVHQQHLTLL